MTEYQETGLDDIATAFFEESNNKRGFKYTANAIGFTLALMFFLQFFISFFVHIYFYITGYTLNSLGNTILQAVLYFFYLSVPVVVFSIITMPTAGQLGFKPPKPAGVLASIPLSFMVLMAGALMSMVIQLIMKLLGLPVKGPEFIPPVGYPYGLLAFVISTAVLPAIFEELLFRGLILGSLRKYGDKFALIISSILFSIIHANLQQAPYAFILGLFIGFMVIKTNSVFTGIIIHFINNLYACVITWINTAYPENSNVQMLLGIGVFILLFICFFISLGIIIYKATTDPGYFKLGKNPRVLLPSGFSRAKAIFLSPGVILSLFCVLAGFILFQLGS